MTFNLFKPSTYLASKLIDNIRILTVELELAFNRGSCVGIKYLHLKRFSRMRAA